VPAADGNARQPVVHVRHTTGDFMRPVRVRSSTIEGALKVKMMRSTSTRSGPAMTPRLDLVPVLVLALLLAGSTAGAAQSTPDPAVQPVVVTFATADGSTFRAVLAQPADIAAVQEALAGDGNAGIPNGRLEYGDGGVNAPHDWHMVDTTLADLTIELCDATATMVDEDVTYWVETVGQFCPWIATVIAVEPIDSGPNPTEPPGDGATELPDTGVGATATTAPSSTSQVLLMASGFAAVLLAFVLIQRHRVR